MKRRARARAGVALSVAALVAACGEPASDDNAADMASAGISTVTFRLWDEAAAAAYRESFDAFNAIHRDIHVEVEVVPQASYADRAASDLAEGTMADIFWTTSDSVAAHAHGGDLVELREALGEDVESWEAAVTGLYTRDDDLWAVPQVWDSTVLFYNTELVEHAGVDPAALSWDPAVVLEDAPVTAAAPGAGADGGSSAADGGSPADPAPAGDGPEEGEPDAEELTEPEPAEPPEAAPSSTDTLRQAVRELTVDSHGRTATEEDFEAGDVVQHGFNTDLTAPAVWLPFLAQLGAVPQSGDDLTLAGPEGRAVFAYLAELPASPAPDTGATSRELFTSGEVALFQATSADIRYVAEHAEVDWGLAPAPAGPEGAVAVVDGIAAAANAASADPEATVEVLHWIASTDGQSALASHGVGVPAATGAQELFVRAWADRGVEVSAAVGAESVVTAASGPRAQAVLETVRPVLAQMFRGELPVPEALLAAQQAAEAELGS